MAQDFRLSVSAKKPPPHAVLTSAKSSEAETTLDTAKLLRVDDDRDPYYAKGAEAMKRTAKLQPKIALFSTFPSRN